MPIVCASSDEKSRPLNRADYKVLLVATLSSALSVYDFLLFVYFIFVISKLFIPTGLSLEMMLYPQFAMFFASVVAAPFGGVVMAHYGYLLGRRNVLTLSILLMALSTLIVVLVPSYEQIGLAALILVYLARILQGAAKGAQIPAAFALISERIPAGKLGYACGILACAPALGVLMAGLVVGKVLSTHQYDEVREYAWRIPFIAGIAVGVVLAFFCHRLAEDPASTQLQSSEVLPSSTPFKAVMRNHDNAANISSLLAFLLSGGLTALVGGTRILTNSGHTWDVVLRSANVALISFCVGSVTAGILTSRLGEARVLMMGSVGLFIASWAFFGWLGDPDMLYPTYAVLGFFLGTFGIATYLMVSLFHPVLRPMGMAFSYNLGASMMTVLLSMPFMLSIFSEPLQAALGVGVLCGMGLMVGSMLQSRKGLT